MKRVEKEEDMRGLFTIMKGKYRSGKSEDILCTDGFNPTSPDTVEWYQVSDKIVWHTFYAGTSYDKALRAVYNMIKNFGTRRKYFKWVCDVTSEDYYGVHYLNQTPLTPDQRSEKACDGRCPRASESTRRLHSAVYDKYHYYFVEDLEKTEEEVYSVLNNDVLAPSRRALRRAGGTCTNVSTIDDSKEPVPESGEPILRKKLKLRRTES